MQGKSPHRKCSRGLVLTSTIFSASFLGWGNTGCLGGGTDEVSVDSVVSVGAVGGEPCSDRRLLYTPYAATHASETVPAPTHHHP